MLYTHGLKSDCFRRLVSFPSPLLDSALILGLWVTLKRQELRSGVSVFIAAWPGKGRDFENQQVFVGANDRVLAQEVGAFRKKSTRVWGFSVVRLACFQDTSTNEQERGICVLGKDQLAPRG